MEEDGYSDMSSLSISTLDVVGLSSAGIGSVEVDGELTFDFVYDSSVGRLTVNNLGIQANRDFEITWA